MALRSYGLTGTVRLSLGEHAVIEAKPEESDHDLRLSNPWPELWDFADGPQFKLAALDDVTFKHVPYAVLLLQAAHSWRGAPEHGGLSSTLKPLTPTTRTRKAHGGRGYNNTRLVRNGSRSGKTTNRDE